MTTDDLRSLTAQVAAREELEEARLLAEGSRASMRAAADALLDPQVLLEPRRDSSGRIVDFIYREVNRATSSYLGLTEEQLIGRGVVETMPGLESALLSDYISTLETGEPLILNDFSYDNEVLDDTRRYDIRVTRATSDSLVLTWRDVTERFRSTRSLAEARDLLRASTDAMLDMQAVAEAITDSVGKVVDLVLRDVNTAFCDYLSLPRSELVDRSMLSVFPNMVSSGLMARCARCAMTGEPVALDDFEYVVEVIGGPRRFDIRAAQVRPGLITATIRDVTERFTASERVAESEEQYRLLAENSSDAVVRVRDGVCIWASPAIAAVLGGPPAHWIGRRLLDLIPSGDEPAHRERLSGLAAGQQIQTRVRVQGFDGTLHWVHLRASPFHDAHGNTDGIVAALRLIDSEVAAEELAAAEQRMRAEAEAGYRALLESDRALLRATADSMLDPQVLYEVVRNADGQVVDFRFLSVNRATCLYLNVGEEELVGRSVLDAFPNMVASGLMERYTQCLEDGQPVILTDFSYFNDMLDEARRYDLRATRAGNDLLSLTWSDVTERFEAARLIAESEQKYRLLTQNSSDVITHVRDGRFVWVSPSIETMLGAPPEYWTGRDVQEIIPAEDVRGFTERLATLDAGGTVQRRIRLKSVDGVKHWVYTHSTPFFDADGRQDGFTSTMRLADDDVAAEREIEQAHRERARADALYRKSIDSAAVGMCLADVEGRLTDVNPALCRFLGYDAEALQAKTWQDVTAADYLQTDLEKRNEILDGTIESYRLVKRFVHADGHLLWGDLSVGCVRDDDGQVATFIKQIIDITAERQAREQLEEARHREAVANALYRRSVDNAAIGMCLIDPDGRFVDVNDALCRFFGYDAETLKTKTWQELTAPEFLEADLSKVNDVLLGRLNSYRLLKKYRHADGHPIWGDLSVSCIRDESGLVEHFVSQINDVTETVEANALNTALNQRLTDELHSAATYMASIMPSGLTGRVNITSRYIPSRQLGGDCLDYHWLDDDHLMVYLIDVSGHGLEPALLSVSLQNMLRSGTFSLETLVEPKAVLTELNRLFQMDQQNDHFFTMWYGIYSARTGILSYANAGAPPAFAFACPPGTDCAPVELMANARPVGIFEDTEFDEGSYSVPPGCRVLLFTDGASELLLSDGQQLSLDGFAALASRVATKPDWSLDDIVDALRGLALNGLFEDDLSMVLLAFD